MQNEKKNNKPVEKKDSTFSLKGLIEEFHKIRWPRWKSFRGEPGIFENSAKVIGFSLTIIVFFMVSGLIIAKALQLIGIV